MAAVEMTEPNRRSFAVRGGAIENRESFTQGKGACTSSKNDRGEPTLRGALERSDRQKERPGSGVDRAFRISSKLGRSIRQIAL